MRLAAGLCPDSLGELECFPRPPSRNRGRGPSSKGKGEKGGEGLPPLYLTSGYRPGWRSYTAVVCLSTSVVTQCSSSHTGRHASQSPSLTTTGMIWWHHALTTISHCWRSFTAVVHLSITINVFVQRHKVVTSELLRPVSLLLRKGKRKPGRRGKIGVVTQCSWGQAA